jgi:hypothetical protein
LAASIFLFGLLVFACFALLCSATLSLLSSSSARLAAPTSLPPAWQEGKFTSLARLAAPPEEKTIFDGSEGQVRPTGPSLNNSFEWKVKDKPARGL